MIAWAFHRISGIGIFAFVVLHVVDIYLVGGNPALYDEVLGLLREPARAAARGGPRRCPAVPRLNGLRIIILDLWPAMTAYHRQLWWASWIIFIVVGVPGALIILRPVWLPFLQQLGLA